MYIQPNTTIKFYSGIPLDKTYEHTLWFENKSLQDNYFHSSSVNVIQVFPENTYQRVNKGIMRVGVSADALYNANYLAFHNTNYGNKWFYAFVTSVEYVNNNACEVTYEIDVMQTYLFDVDLKQCLVEREHSATDNVGDNVVPESLDVGYYLKSSYNFTSDVIKNLKAYSLIIACGYNTSAKEPSPIFTRAGIISGVDYYMYDILLENGQVDAVALQDASDKVNEIIDAGQTDAIINMFMFPTALRKASGYVDAGTVSFSLSELSKNKWHEKGLSGYYPKNNKCYTSPYNTIYVGDWNGETSMLLKPELIESSTGIAISGALCSTPSALVYPTVYAGETYNYFEGYTVKRFPQVAFTTDSYRAYIAQGGLANDVINVLSSTVNIGGTTASVGTGLTSADINTGISSATSIMGSQLGLASSVTNLLYKMNMPENTHGSTSADVLTALHTPFVRVENRHIHLDILKSIDDYFSKYGYATNKLKVPNRNVRKQWCYTKTNGCVVNGNAPSDDIAKICKIYDKGITFWKNANNVGNYLLSNTPS